MTREEFIEKYNLDDTYDSYDKKIIDLFDEKAASYEKNVEEHRKNGNLMSFCQEEIDSNSSIFYVIDVFLSVQEHDEYLKLYEQSVRKLIKDHMEKGTLESWIFDLKKNDKDKYYFVIQQTNVQQALINTHVKDSDFENWIFTNFEELGQLVLLDNYKVKDELIDRHIKDNDIDKWLPKLKRYIELDELFMSCNHFMIKPKIEDGNIYNSYIADYTLQSKLKEIYSKKITEHRKAGDLIDYIWELTEKNELNLGKIKSSSNQKSIEYLIGVYLNKKEKEEIGILETILDYINKDYLWWTGGWFEGWQDSHNSVFSYLFKLSQCSKDSIEQKRYQKIRSKIEKVTELERFDKDIKKYTLIRRLIKIGIIAGAALILVLIGAFSINRAVTKNARMAKKEAQRIERVKVKKTKDIKKAQEHDLQQLEKLSAKKISKQELLVQTTEPTMYVIAPMTYDTNKFSQDNSHDSAMFGFKTVDNSVERLGILETCITDFENNVDEITGVSFLDRSKISQIEKEHKFQLGDWSNNKKTAEVGKALNANILLFLNKFTYVDAGSGQYRFEAKFVDVNTMQSTSFVVAYKNPKKKIVTPEVISQISFRDFTPISTKNDSFDDELYLKTQNVIRTVQKKDMKIVSPLGVVTKVQTSEFDVNTPKTEFANASSIKFDGFGELELDLGNETKSYSYTFEANEIFIERNGYNFYTDGKIGVLTVKTDGGYEKFDVFTDNNREYYLRLGSVELEKAFVNYYLQMVKQ